MSTNADKTVKNFDADSHVNSIQYFDGDADADVDVICSLKYSLRP